MHPTFTLFGQEYVSYDVITQVGAFIGLGYILFVFWKLNFKPLPIAICLILTVPVQYFGGTLIPLLYRWVYYHQTPWWNVWEKSPGRYFHSVILSVIVYVIIYCKCVKWPTKKVLDHTIIALLIASSIARIGCFMEGCCGGKPCDLPWAMKFPRQPDVSVHPTQIYMVILETALWIFLILFNRKKRYDGQTFWMAVFLYSIYRIGLECVRTNPIFIYGMTHAQTFSVFTLLLSATMLFLQRSKPGPLKK